MKQKNFYLESIKVFKYLTHSEITFFIFSTINSTIGIDTAFPASLYKSLSQRFGN